MATGHRKSITFRLTQAAKAHRGRSTTHLGRIGLHPGQEALIKALSEEDGQTMSQLAAALAVQPPTVTKMVNRLSAQGIVRRQASETDGRLARVFLTDEGRARVADIDRAWKRIEKEALDGIDDKDRKRLRKLLKQIERNLSEATGAPHPGDDLDEAEEPLEDAAAQ